LGVVLALGGFSLRLRARLGRGLFPAAVTLEKSVEVLSFLLYTQDFRARMPEKGSCCATDGASASGPSVPVNDRAENLELPAFLQSHTRKGTFSPSGCSCQDLHFL